MMEKPKIKIRERDDKKGKKTNRVLLFVIFLLTGLVSLAFWARGKSEQGLPVINIAGNQGISYVIKTNTPTPSPKANGKRESVFLDSLKQLTATASGTYGIYLYDVESRRKWGLNESEVVPAMSIFKVPVMVYVLEKVEKGELRLADTYTLEDADRSLGSGPLQYQKTGTIYTIEQLLTYLGRNSDNTAWMMFNRRLGRKAIGDMVDQMGMLNSSYVDMTTTAEDVGIMFQYVYSLKRSNSEMWGHLEKYLTESIYEDRLSVGLNLQDIKLIHKVGTDVNVWSDAGIVECQDGVSCDSSPFVLAILNRDIKRDEATWVVPRITTLAWDFLSYH